MRYLALATDYDGTLASDGHVGDRSRQALERLRNSGRKVILVTGRELEDLFSVCHDVSPFDWIVAENGALLHRPADGVQRLLAGPPPDKLVAAVRRRGVEPLSIGHVLLATWEPHEAAVLEAIREAGLDYQVIFNKGAVMVLPGGINKATGLRTVLEELGLSAHNLVGIGDAENDHAFLSICQCAVAVANAIPPLQERCDLVTRGPRGAGVVELVDQLLADDLASLDSRLGRHSVLLGVRADGGELRLPPFGENVLIAGSPGSGKSTLATALVERLVEGAYQVTIIDPEGDYESLEGFVALGGNDRPATIDEAMTLLQKQSVNAAINMVGLRLVDRPLFFLSLLARLQDLRTQFGRPHWLVIDEAHHVLPAAWEPARLALPKQLDRTVLITVQPSSLDASVLSLVDTMIAVGEEPAATIEDFCRVQGRASPDFDERGLESGEVLVWRLRTAEGPLAMRIPPARAERRRHVRKYAEGNLGSERSFCFRGPHGQLKLLAYNLMLFVQMAEGVDDATWLHHLRRGDYSSWFRQGIKDPALADEAAQIEQDRVLSAAESRAAIVELVRHRYTVPVGRGPHEGAAR